MDLKKRKKHWKVTCENLLRTNPHTIFFKNISENTYRSFKKSNINESIAEFGVLEQNIFDKELNKKVLEVLNYGYYDKNE